MRRWQIHSRYPGFHHGYSGQQEYCSRHNRAIHSIGNIFRQYRPEPDGFGYMELIKYRSCHHRRFSGNQGAGHGSDNRYHYHYRNFGKYFGLDHINIRSSGIHFSDTRESDQHCRHESTVQCNRGFIEQCHPGFNKPGNLEFVEDGGCHDQRKRDYHSRCRRFQHYQRDLCRHYRINHADLGNRGIHCGYPCKSNHSRRNHTAVFSKRNIVKCSYPGHHIACHLKFVQYHGCHDQRQRPCLFSFNRFNHHRRIFCRSFRYNHLDRSSAFVHYRNACQSKRGSRFNPAVHGNGSFFMVRA